MNVYDFDKTVYRRDSSSDFWLFMLSRHVSVLGSLPRAAAAAVGYIFGRKSFLELKQALFSFLAHIPDAKSEVESFWDRKMSGIYGWYLENRRPDDIVISASPEFLVAPACARLGVADVIATRMDIGTGLIEGKNCKGGEKVVRLKERYPDATVESFYSDSYSDTPLACLAKDAYIIKKGRPSPWVFRERR